MNYIKRAFISIMRRKGKSGILLLLIFVLGNVIAGAISVQQATANVGKTIKSQMGVAATIEIDYKNLSGGKDEFDKLPKLSEELIQQIGKMDMVRTYNYSNHVAFMSPTLKRYVSPDNDMNEDNAQNVGESTTQDTYVLVTGTHNPNILDVEEGKGTITSGRVFTEAEITGAKYVAVVGKGFAETNNLKVGDSIMAKNKVMDYGAMTGKQTSAAPEPKILGEQDVTVEIIGIYDPKPIAPNANQDNTGKSGGFDQSVYQNESNQNIIFMPTTAVNQELKFQTDVSEAANATDGVVSGSGIFQPLYILKEPEDLDRFKEEVTALVPKEYVVTTSADDYSQVAGPMKSMQGLAELVLYVSIGATLLIVCLLIILFLRDRRPELGIYLSLGEKRGKVVTQIILEVIVVAFIAMSASLVTGNFIAQSVSERMITNQLEAEQEQDQMGMIGGGSSLSVSGYGSNITTDDVVNAYEVKFTATYVLLFYLVGLGSIVLSTIGPVIYILRLNPKKIML